MSSYRDCECFRNQEWWHWFDVEIAGLPPKSFEIVKKQTTFYTSEHFLAQFFQAFSNNFIYGRALDSLSLRSLYGQVCLVIFFRLKMNTSIKFETKEEHESWMIKVEQFTLAFLKALT